MIHSPIQATIFYSHSQGEVDELAQAIQPMMDHIRAVGSDAERQRLRAILLCNEFRRRDVVAVKNMLLRAAKHARNHLSEYFPTMQEAVIAQAEALEDATEHYHKRFKALQVATIPVN